MLDHSDTAKRAGSAISTIGRVISDVVEAGAGYINSAAGFMARHQSTIDAAGKLGSIGASLAQIGGLIKPSTADRIHHGIGRITSKPKTKSGGGWKDFA